MEKIKKSANKEKRNKMKLGKSIKKYLVFLFILCMLFIMTGCGKESQFTQIDDKYKTTVQQGVSDDADATADSTDPSQTEQTIQPDSTKEQEADKKGKTKKEKNATKDQKSKDNTTDQAADPKASESSQKASDSKNKNTAFATKSKKNTSKKSTSAKKSAANKNTNSNQTTKNANSTTNNSSAQNASQQDNTSSKEETKDFDQKKDTVTPAATPQPNTCTISIDCKTILANRSNLKSSKVNFVPADGVILKNTTVELKKNDTVYDILSRVCKSKKIHMDANYTPAYKTYYVRGIHQLYELDCGNLSGWTYQVNGIVPNYGCSKYTVKTGDVITWRYTCDGGKDVK